MKLSKEFGISQSALARYETNDAMPPLELLLKYANYFDISMDYIFGRTNYPRGTTYKNHVNVNMNNPEMARSVEMCFNPGSPMNERLKATLIQMLSKTEHKEKRRGNDQMIAAYISLKTTAAKWHSNP